MTKFVEKAWGSELWIENNELYCGKILTLKKGFFCSVHYHKLKDESFFILKGKVKMELFGETKIMKEGDTVRLKPNTVHRFTGLEDSKIIEISTKHIDSDSYRITESGRV
jgi:quercetin dioxygenase-like cupin family protein